MESQHTTNTKIIILCSFVFILISYLVFRTNLPKSPNIILYNLVIIVAFQKFGFNKGLFFLGASAFLTLLISISNNFYYIFNLPMFFIFSFIVNNEVKKCDYAIYTIASRIEEIKEDTNVLVDVYNRHKKEAALLEKKENRYKSLRDVTAALSSTLSLDEVTDYILDNVLSVIGKSESALLFLVDTEKQELKLVSSRVDKNAKKIMTKKGDFLDEWVFKQRQCLLVEDIKKDFRFGENNIKDHHKVFRSVISSPLMEERKVIGIVRLQHSRPYNYNSEDLRLLDILCDLGAVSLENADFYKQTLDLAITDGLTHLYLRRYFLDKFREELTISLHDDLRCSLLMIDIDNFKNYNDKYGHIAGDIVLKTLSRILKEFSGDGVVCRYGGEEFAMLLPETPKKEAKKIAEDMRKAVKKEIIELRRLKTNITVSIGIASFPDDAKLMEDIILAADERLYKAKRKGRNRVVSE